ncbi:MAG: hypothetical protein AB1558_00805 [Thermodesulfobacteriota bacterium]
MSEEMKPVDVLETQITAISDTQKNLAGLIEKAARVQSDLLSGGFQEFSDAIGEPFTLMSAAVEKLQDVLHRAEIEKNRIRNEE